MSESCAKANSKVAGANAAWSIRNRFRQRIPSIRSTIITSTTSMQHQLASKQHGLPQIALGVGCSKWDVGWAISSKRHVKSATT